MCALRVYIVYGYMHKYVHMYVLKYGWLLLGLTILSSTDESVGFTSVVLSLLLVYDPLSSSSSPSSSLFSNAVICSEE